MRDKLTVGTVARLADVTPKTVRYYESLGLLPPAQRGENGYRCFDREAVNRLAFIQRAKVLGLSLNEIRELMAVSDEGLCAVIGPELQQVVKRKLADCDRRLAELSAFRATLAAAAERLAATNAAAAAVCPNCSAFTPDCTCLSSASLDIAPRATCRVR